MRARHDDALYLTGRRPPCPGEVIVGSVGVGVSVGAEAGDRAAAS